MRVCRACGHTNEEREQFCVSCGRFLEFTGEELATGTSPAVPREPAAGPHLATPPPPRQPPTGSASGPAARSEADVPTGELPIVGPGPPVGPSSAGGAGTQRLGSSYPEVPDGARPGGPGGIRPSDVEDRTRQRAPDTIERSTLGPGELPCPRCGTGNTRERTFCRRCGERLRFDAAPVVVAAPAAPERTRRRRFPRGLLPGTLLALLLAAGGVAGWRWSASSDENRPQPSTTAVPPTATSTVSAAPASSPKCPDLQQLTEVRQEQGGQPTFAFDAGAAADAVVVLQFMADPYVTTICRDSAGGYWYFSRQSGDEGVGVYSAAKASGDSFVAHYPGNDTITYRVDHAGTTVVGQKTYALTSYLCASPADLPAGLLGPGAPTPPPCTATSVTPWNPRS